MLNRFGLGRDIPSSIKREVRRRDGFGCVICGKAIYDYEHIDPEFSQASAHLADGIVLLCISCHGKKTRGFLSKATILKAKNNPKCRQQGFSFEEFDVGTDFPEIALGALNARNVTTLIEINGDSIFSIRPPLFENLPFRISAHLTNPDGTTVLKIEDNEWQSPIENWDVETGGGRIVIRRGPGDIILALRCEPPNRLVIERINMAYQGTIIRGREHDNVTITSPSGTKIALQSVSIDGFEVGIRITSSGIALGCGGRSASLRKAEIMRAPSHLNAAGNIRRNSTCSCGSGKKYKHCCGKYSATR